MKWIKNGKLVLNGTKNEEELQDWLNKGLELIIDKKVDIDILQLTYNVNDYNRNRTCVASDMGFLTKEEFEFLKEITTIW